MKVLSEFGSQGVMSVAEAAKFLGKSPRTICRWCDDDTLRWMRHRDGSRGIDRNDVMEYLQSNQQ